MSESKKKAAKKTAKKTPAKKAAPKKEAAKTVSDQELTAVILQAVQEAGFGAQAPRKVAGIVKAVRGLLP